MKNYTVLFAIVLLGACAQKSSLYAQDTLKVKFHLTGNRCTGDTLIFIDDSYANKPVSSRIWTFGDGQNSTAAKPVHVYSHIGNYRISLVIQLQTGTTDSFV